jgi:hypothetical protein
MIAGIITLGGFIPYWQTICSGKTRPNRATWLIWTIVGTIIAYNYREGGADATMWVPISYVIGPLLTSILSIKFGEGGWTTLDRICLIGVAIGLILWWLYQLPFLTLGINIGIDFLGAIPTIHKSFREPYSENLFAWWLFWLGNVLNVLAIDRWELQIIIHPIYMLLVTTAICGCLRWGRLQAQRARRDRRRKIHLN